MSCLYNQRMGYYVWTEQKTLTSWGKDMSLPCQTLSCVTGLFHVSTTSELATQQSWNGIISSLAIFSLQKLLFLSSIVLVSQINLIFWFSPLFCIFKLQCFTWFMSSFSVCLPSFFHSEVPTPTILRSTYLMVLWGQISMVLQNESSIVVTYMCEMYQRW